MYSKIDFKVLYPPPYEREKWHYQRTNVDQIQRATEQPMKLSLYLIKLSRTLFQIIILTKESLLMTEIHLGITKKSSI